MKVGDLVCLASKNKLDIKELGIITNIITDVTDDPLDMMFPFHVLFASYGGDWFGESALEVVSESR